MVNLRDHRQVRAARYPRKIQNSFGGLGSWVCWRSRDSCRLQKTGEDSTWAGQVLSGQVCQGQSDGLRILSFVTSSGVSVDWGEVAFEPVAVLFMPFHSRKIDISRLEMRSYGSGFRGLCIQCLKCRTTPEAANQAQELQAF